MEKSEDFWNHNTFAKTCVHCTNPDGSIKSCEMIFKDWVQFFVQTLKANHELAERLVRRNMLQLPYRKSLNGEIATEEEFADAMKKL